MTNPASGPVAVAEADVVAFVHSVEARAEKLAADFEGAIERHAAPDVAHAIAFIEHSVTNATAFQTAVVAAINHFNPNATAEEQRLLDAIQAAAADGQKLAAGVLAWLASKAPKSQTEPVAKAG